MDWLEYQPPGSFLSEEFAPLAKGLLEVRQVPGG